MTWSHHKSEGLLRFRNKKIFIYVGLASFLGFKILNFNIFGVYEDFCGHNVTVLGHHLTGLFLGHFLEF